jgi:Ca2+/H+ antiporter
MRSSTLDLMDSSEQRKQQANSTGRVSTIWFEVGNFIIAASKKTNFNMLLFSMYVFSLFHPSYFRSQSHTKRCNPAYYYTTALLCVCCYATNTNPVTPTSSRMAHSFSTQTHTRASGCDVSIGTAPTRSHWCPAGWSSPQSRP